MFSPKIMIAGFIAAMATAAVVAPAVSAEAATVCSSSSCVTNLEVQPGGLSIGTTFTTAVPTSDHLYVYRNGTLLAEGVNASLRTQHQLTSTAKLAANTSYSWHLLVTDAGGHVVEKTGTVKTLHRQVDVMFSTISVINDSDASGSGEFRTWLKAGTQSGVSLFTPTDIDSGSTVLAVNNIRVLDADVTLPVAVEMYDDDVPSFDPLQIFLPNFPKAASWDTGSSFAGDWATAKRTLDTKNATTTLVPFTMSVTDDVAFVVHASYVVTFVA